MEILQEVLIFFDQFELLYEVICQILCIIGIVCFVLCEVQHYPADKIPPEVIEKIRENGLVHYTEARKCDMIIAKGLKPNNFRNHLQERNFVWTYLWTDMDTEAEKKLKKLEKSNKKRFNACIRIEDLSDEQLSKLKYRKRDGAIVYPGKLITNNMHAEIL